MTGFLSFICALAILLGFIGLGFVVLWLVFGRKKRGEDKAIGILECMAHFKATSMIDGMYRRIR